MILENARHGMGMCAVWKRLWREKAHAVGRIAAGNSPTKAAVYPEGR